MTQCVHGTKVDDKDCAICTAEHREAVKSIGVNFTILDDVIPEKKESALSVQVGGDHYKDRKIQPVQYIEANQLGFLEGCVVKRVSRHNMPTGKGKQDIEKAIHELQLLLELRYGQS